MFKILGAKNRRKNLHKHPGPPFQIRGGPGSFSNAQKIRESVAVDETKSAYVIYECPLFQHYILTKFSCCSLKFLVHKEKCSKNL